MAAENLSARRIAMENLKPGMVLARDLVNEEGEVILRRSAVLDRENFNIIILNSSPYVLILEDSISADRPSFFETSANERVVPADVPVREQEDFKSFLHEYSAKSEELDSEFKRIARGEAVNHEQLFGMIDTVMSRLKTKSDVIVYMDSLKDTDRDAYSHSINVGLLANLFGIWINASQKDLENLTVAALLHDIGMTQISKEILDKKGNLSRQEFDAVKKHTTLGFRMLEQSGMSEDIKFTALSHHERIDGSGYPLGIKGSKINRFAKIVCICDVYAAMTAHREYRERMSPFDVIKRFEWESYGLFDTEALLLFLKNIAFTYLNSPVRLSDGREGIVAFINTTDLSRPIIKLSDGSFLDLFKDRKTRVAELINV